MKVTIETSLSDLFNAFIADELWAALNYKNAAFVSKGKALKFSNGIFEDNSDEEFEHMEELIDMAQSLGIKVEVNPKDAEKNCTTPYVNLSPDEDTSKLVELFLKSEKSAIEGYQIALKNENVLEKPELLQFFGEICNDEHNHLKELMDLASNVGVDDGIDTEETDDSTTTDVDDEAEGDSEKDDGDEDDTDGVMSISPLTGTSKKSSKKSKKDDEEEEDEKDDEKSKDDDSEEDEDDDEDESVNESTIPYCKDTSSVRCMLKKAFSGVNKKAK